ncbi:MAG: ornithine carbamoyltransferase [Bifidobacteriaceae bacterium]|jgi:ornithine carbamoyltransferase|nr:ornithine carbamoyltransferase [Bifidobacteriaceae bacterium]
MPRHFLRDDSLSQLEQREVLALALELKARPFDHQVLKGPRAVAILFDKSSTRTRVSFSVGVAELGGYPLVIEASSSQIGRGESIEDTARVLDRQCAAIVWRTFGQERVETMAANSAVPVINALTDQFHPCQVLADLLTVAEEFGGIGALPGMRLAYLGDCANNMAHSYLLAGALAGMDVALAGPSTHQPDPQILADAKRLAAAHGGRVSVSDNPLEAITDAAVVTTDAWVSMGMEDQRSQRQTPFIPYQVNSALLSQAASDAIFLHCLPAYRGQEVTAEVIDGPASRVWQEAENRLHVQKALLSWLVEQS